MKSQTFRIRISLGNCGSPEPGRENKEQQTFTYNAPTCIHTHVHATNIHECAHDIYSCWVLAFVGLDSLEDPNSFRTPSRVETKCTHAQEQHNMLH